MEQSILAYNRAKRKKEQRAWL